jgi:hypothetical protein
MRKHSSWGLATVAFALAALSNPGVAQDTSARVSDPPLAVRTFTVRHMSPLAARELIVPYAQSPRATVSPGPQGVSVITVRDTPAALDAMARVLEQFDRAPAMLTFRFQLIVATDSARRDPAIAGVEPLLRDLFRFGGYRLLSQTAVNASEGSHPSQTIGEAPDRFNLNLDVESVEVDGAAGSVRIDVSLWRPSNLPATANRDVILSTGLTIPIGQTVVLGSGVANLGPAMPDAKALILTVRPEIAGATRR